MEHHKVNFTQYRKGQKKGHYESFFLRANHPTEPRAFWIRYTIFSPDQHPEKAIGELWAIYFEKSTGKHITVKKEVDFENCVFDHNRFYVKIKDAELEYGKLHGSSSSNENTIGWDLNFSGDASPMFLLPIKLYKGSFPKAKAITSLPLAKYSGTLKVNGKTINIYDWIGSQNHNWGVKHTDLYAWGQVVGFDNSPDSFFELATVRLRYGPVWTPYLTIMVLRHNGQEFHLNTIMQSLKSKGKFGYFYWNFYSKMQDVTIEGEISAEKQDFVGLPYNNPPGGIKHCLNSKIAACQISVQYKNASGEMVKEVMETMHRAAFEILTDKRDHGIEMK